MVRYRQDESGQGAEAGDEKIEHGGSMSMGIEIEELVEAEAIGRLEVGPDDKAARSSQALAIIVPVISQSRLQRFAKILFNDPPRRVNEFIDAPPSPAQFRQLGARVVDLHPLTIAQNARTSGGGNISLVPTQAITVGPAETWKAEKVSIWHAGRHDNPFGQRLTALMISERVPDTAVPMSLLADHPNVQFNYFSGGLGSCEIVMH